MVLTQLNICMLSVSNNFPSNYASHVAMFAAVLNLSQNNITSLDSPSFRGMRYLRWSIVVLNCILCIVLIYCIALYYCNDFIRRLYFDFNQISQIGRRTFQSLKRFLSLSLSLHYAIPGTNFRVTRNVSCRFKVHITGCPIIDYT